MKKIIVLILLVCSWNMFALYLPKSMQGNKKLRNFIPEGSLMIRGKDEKEGFIVKKDIAIQNSAIIKNMVEDLGDGGDRIITLGAPLKKETIKLFFDISSALKNSKTFQLNNFQLKQLVDVANIMDFMEGPQENRIKVLAEIRNVLHSSPTAALRSEFDQLSSDLKKLLITVPCVQGLNDLIIAKYPDWKEWNNQQTVSSISYSPKGMLSAYGFYQSLGIDNSRQRYFQVRGLNRWDENIGRDIKSVIHSVAFSSDGRYVVAAGMYDPQGKNVFVYDFNMQVMTSYNVNDLGLITCVKFIPSINTTKIICAGSENRLKIVDIVTGKQVFDFQFDANHASQITSMDCSFKPKLIAIGFTHNTTDTLLESLVLWDMSKFDYDRPQKEDIQNIKFDAELLDIDQVTCLAISPDGKKIVMGGATFDLKRVLVLLDITNTSKITQKMLKDYDQVRVTAVAFSNNGKSILVGLEAKENNLELFDISDTDNIVSNRFTGIKNYIYAVAIDPFDENGITFGGQYSDSIQSYVGFSQVNNDATLIDRKIYPDEQQEVVKIIRKNCTADQLLFIYRLYVQRPITIQSGSSMHQQFMQLSQHVQKLLKDLSVVIEEAQPVSPDAEIQHVDANESWIEKMVRKTKALGNALARGYMQYAS
jgi:WD40 repeat protein